ncbi:MAG TPA: hypothetical protein VF846_01715 [Thermoanaerobaculia bacterium]
MSDSGAAADLLETSANDADSESFGIDVAPFASSIKTIGTNAAPIRTYATAARAIPMGPQPIVIGGSPAGSYDPLSNRADVKTALYAAQAHAQDVLQSIDSLHAWADGGATEMVGQITTPLQTARAVLERVPSGGTLSPEDAQTIYTQIQLAVIYIQLVQMVISQIANSVRSFTTQILNDHETLARGPLALAQVVEEVGRQINADALPYIINPLSRGIGETILQIGRTFIAAATQTSAVIGNAMTEHEAMRAAATALANASETARAKVEAAHNAVARADSASLSVVMRRLNLNSAIASWNQFADFFTRSGL